MKKNTEETKKEEKEKDGKRKKKGSDQDAPLNQSAVSPRRRGNIFGGIYFVLAAVGYAYYCIYQVYYAIRIDGSSFLDAVNAAGPGTVMNLLHLVFFLALLLGAVGMFNKRPVLTIIAMAGIVVGGYGDTLSDLVIAVQNGQSGSDLVSYIILGVFAWVPLVLLFLFSIPYAAVKTRREKGIAAFFHAIWFVPSVMSLVAVLYRVFQQGNDVETGNISNYVTLAMLILLLVGCVVLGLSFTMLPKRKEEPADNLDEDGFPEDDYEDGFPENDYDDGFPEDDYDDGFPANDNVYDPEEAPYEDVYNDVNDDAYGNDAKESLELNEEKGRKSGLFGRRTGKKQGNPAEQEASDVCPACGTPYEGDETFCVVCGEPRKFE